MRAEAIGKLANYDENQYKFIYALLRVTDGDEPKVTDALNEGKIYKIFSIKVFGRQLYFLTILHKRVLSQLNFIKNNILVKCLFKRTRCLQTV